jgi:2-polyprenyl-3-methyl-5-hydroxy-6-metoxy-1,4-benzoquinol methylase
MKQYLNYIGEKIETLSPIHSKKIKKNSAFYDDRYYELADAFFKKYIKILENDNKTLDYAIDCYLKMVADINSETVEFFRSGKYTSSTFEEVNNRVYGRPETMEYYMHGLIMSQFLWKHHYQIFDYFINTLPHYAHKTKSYLEIGAGHGLYLSKALEILDNKTTFTVVDISKTSIELAKRFTDDDRVTFNLKDIFDFNDNEKYDFITLGEVLEHVEDPLKLLLKLNDLLTEDGVLYLTTPTNAPTIDHIYLFNNVQEIRDLIKLSGFEILSEMPFLAEDVSAEKAEKFKVTILYGAFLKKNNGN